jgi:hypothetical protein
MVPDMSGPMLPGAAPLNPAPIAFWSANAGTDASVTKAEIAVIKNLLMRTGKPLLVGA